MTKTVFSAFVDIGVQQDGLVHVSQLADRFVRDPNEVVKVQQQVMVTVLEVDSARKRISLTMKTNPEAAATPKPREDRPAYPDDRPKAQERPRTPERPRQQDRPRQQERARTDKPRNDSRKPSQREEAPMNDWAQQLKNKFGG